jgi:hypothetical protein
LFDEEGYDPREEASLWMPETGQHSKERFVSGGVPHPRNLISYPLYRQTPTDDRRRRGRTRVAWSHKYCVGCRGQPRAAPRSHRHPTHSQCRCLEGGPTATTASAACFFPACYPSSTGNGQDEE